MFDWWQWVYLMTKIWKVRYYLEKLYQKIIFDKIRSYAKITCDLIAILSYDYDITIFLSFRHKLC